MPGAARGFSRAIGAAAYAVLSLTSIAFAHPLAEGTAPNVALATWSSEPGVLIALAALAIAYAMAARHARRARISAPLSRWQITAFVAGWLTTAVALVSPIDALGSVLFSAHMIQHELLMIVAAPLLVAGTPPFVLPRTLVRPVALVSSPAIAWMLHATAILAWHVPALFDAAVHDDLVHAAQHLSFFGTALLFWWGVLRGGTDATSYGLAVVSIFTTAVYTTVLGAWLTVAPSAWYSAYSTTTAAWQLTPLEDQQIGGLIMWVPAGIIYTAAGLWLFSAWLKRTDDHARLSRVSQSSMIIVASVGFLSVATACTHDERYRVAAAMTGGDPARGADALSSYGCATCHTIPGVRSARGLVGPPLTSIASRMYLAGRLPNTPDNIRKWIQHPQSVDERTAMPDTGVTDADARDIAAYLYTLR